MSQEPSYNKKDKLGNSRFGNNRPPVPGDDGQGPRKGPKFSIYWIYAIIFAVLIGFQLFGPFTTSTAPVEQDYFQQVLKAGDVEKYVVISNRNIVKIYLKKESIGKYQGKLEKGLSKTGNEGPHMNFKIVSGDSFKDDMRKFYADNPEIKDVGSVDTESDWFSKSLSFLLPILLFVGLWILL
ncbi:MAG: AAA family ATPase, partial [Chitinophagaceae bacterium]